MLMLSHIIISFQLLSTPSAYIWTKFLVIVLLLKACMPFPFWLSYFNHVDHNDSLIKDRSVALYTAMQGQASLIKMYSYGKKVLYAAFTYSFLITSIEHFKSHQFKTNGRTRRGGGERPKKLLEILSPCSYSFLNKG